MTSDDVTSGWLLWKVLNWNTEGNYKNGAVGRQKKKVSGGEKRGNRQVDSGSLASLCHITNSLQQSQVFFLKGPYCSMSISTYNKLILVVNFQQACLVQKLLV